MEIDVYMCGVCVCSACIVCGMWDVCVECGMRCAYGVGGDVCGMWGVCVHGVCVWHV